MAASLDRVFGILRSEGDLPPSALQSLSEMDGPTAKEARHRWADVPLERRRAAMRLAGTLAEDHIELNFDRLSMIGLNDPDGQVRRQAIANLWESEQAGLEKRFLDLLETDDDLSVRAEAARALGRFVLGMEEEESRSPQGQRLERALLAASEAQDERLRWEAVESLGYSSRPEVPGVIQAAYDSTGDAGRRSALVAMGRSGDRRWRDIVMAELRSPVPGTRSEAAHAAGELELRTALPELVDLLDDVTPDVQLQAIWSLGQIGGKTALRALVRAQRDAADDTARVAIEEALEHLAFLEGTRDMDAVLRAQRESE
jgi:HEAT repeat protein